MGKTYFPKRLQPIFSEIERKIIDSLSPKYILLAGSFSKGSWLYDGDRLLSDIEIVFVCESKWSVKMKKEIVSDLNKKFPYKIELKGFLRPSIEKKILSNYSLSNPGYLSLNFFDVFSEPKYLFYGKNEPLNLTIKSDEIPAWEAWRLYVNRMADLLKVLNIENYDHEDCRYYWMKMFEATADAYLIVNKVYHKDIQNREELFSKDLLERDTDLDATCKNSWSLINNALRSRVAHDIKKFDIEKAPGELTKIINSWMAYFERKVAKEEMLPYNNKVQFYKEYLGSNKLQAKYLDVNNGMNIMMSNTIKLLVNRSLLKGNFKWYQLRESWRHHILVIMANLFYEESLGDQLMAHTRNLAKTMFDAKYIDRLNQKEFTGAMIKYWQIVR